MYLAGIDGGGTKTHCIIGDESGNILSEAFSSSSNHQVIGLLQAKNELQTALEKAMSTLHITLDEIGYVHLGLSGADFESDFVKLNGICSEILGRVPFKVSNDCWLGLRLGSYENVGVVTVCGTSVNVAGRNREGKESILRSQGYELGNWGGGVDLIRDALHYAFRSEEMTGKSTRLEQEIPSLLGYKTLAEMVEPFIEKAIDRRTLLGIPSLVMKLSNEGDGVCQELLIKMGRTVGEMTCGIIKRMNLSKERFSVYMIGGLTKGESPLMLDEFKKTVHLTAPYASIGVVEAPPAKGAYLLALDAWRQNSLK